MGHVGWFCGSGARCHPAGDPRWWHWGVVAPGEACIEAVSAKHWADGGCPSYGTL